MSELKQIALVTGSGRGIGKEIAKALAESGYFVYLNCDKAIDELNETAKELCKKSGDCCMALACDVSKSDEVRRMFSVIRKNHAGVDVLVNNAGISHYGLLGDMTDEEWNHIIGINLTSAFNCCKEAIPYMVSKKSGRILNISSVWGNVGASCEVAYSASKSGLNGLTRALAKELAPSGIAVNAAALGVIDTQMNSHLDPQEKAALTESIPAGRFATAKEAAEMCVNILKMPIYMTGQVITMDGGWMA
ncbi:MAG: 3-oxoacyl-ACP reductase FabG [Lachnospiraceae bacterium]|nr:3-oxoacyl-ACP reductase FabG [Lachnospiraceae bacterium]